MHHISDADDLDRARNLQRVIEKLGLPDAERKIIAEGLVLYVESRLQAPVIRQEPWPQGTGFAGLGRMASGLR